MSYILTVTVTDTVTGETGSMSVPFTVDGDGGSLKTGESR